MKSGKVGVLVAGRLEHPVQDALDVLPQAVAPGLDDHAAAHFGILGEIGRSDDLLIPFGKVLLACRSDGGLLWHVRKRDEIQHERTRRSQFKPNRMRVAPTLTARVAMEESRTVRRSGCPLEWTTVSLEIMR